MRAFSRSHLFLHLTAVLGAALLVLPACKGKPVALTEPEPAVTGQSWGPFTIAEHSQSWGELRFDQSVSGPPIVIAGTTYPTGLGTHAVSHIKLYFKRGPEELSGACGLDATANNLGSVVCKVLSPDGQVLWESGLLAGNAGPATFKVPVKGLNGVILEVGDGNGSIDNDHTDWVDLKLQ